MATLNNYILADDHGRSIPVNLHPHLQHRLPSTLLPSRYLTHNNTPTSLHHPYPDKIPYKNINRDLVDYHRRRSRRRTMAMQVPLQSTTASSPLHQEAMVIDHSLSKIGLLKFRDPPLHLLHQAVLTPHSGPFSKLSTSKASRMEGSQI